MRKKRYCVCGASASITGDTMQAVDGALALWQAEHQGDGHGPATKGQAYRARKRNDLIAVCEGGNVFQDDGDPFPAVPSD